MDSIAYGDINIEFNITRKSSLKNTYICIDADGILVKTNNKTTMEEIKRMLQRKSRWIIKKLELIKNKITKQTINTGSRLYYLGKSYYINIDRNKTTQNIAINFTHSKFYIQTPQKFSNEQLGIAIENFYKQKAIEKIIPLAEKWAKEMQVTPKKIGFRRNKSRWGSCNTKNNISFNYHLIKLPMSLIEYVVVHELAHINIKNHSKDFWKLVYKYIQDYKIREKKIRVFEKIF